MKPFAGYIRKTRERLAKDDAAFSLRQVASRVGLEPSYLSKIERGVFPPPSEAVIVKLAQVLGEEPDSLLWMANRMPSDLKQIIMRRRTAFAVMLRELQDTPDHTIFRMVREVRDGRW